MSERLQALLGDTEIEALLSDDAELAAMLAFESALAAAESEVGLLPADSAAAIKVACDAFVADRQRLASGMARDGVAVPALVSALREAVPAAHRASLHKGATSQDLVDTALVLRLRQVIDVLEKRLDLMLSRLRALQRVEGAVRLMAHTRMQAAMAFTAGDKIEAWAQPLLRHRARLAELRPRVLTLQFGGAIGVRGGLDGKGEAVARALAQRLNLRVGPAWHTARDTVAEFAGWLSMVTGALGKIGADVALMAQTEVGEAKLEGGGGSSAMPHKSNPVAAEVLVTLARFNAGMLGTLHQALVHEGERSGAAWTLEWMVLPQMAIAAGAALRHADAMLGSLHFIDKA